MTSATTPPASFYGAFIEYVKSQAVDPGTNARLRRSLRKGSVIGDDAWWILGGWLPDDLDRALIMVRVAAWCAAHHRSPSEPWRTLPKELVMAPKVSEDMARRIIEGVTAEGVATRVRIDRASRAIEMLSDPVRIDWSYLIMNLVDFSRGGERAHKAKHRWYRDYRAIPDNNTNQQQRTTTNDQ